MVIHKKKNPRLRDRTFCRSVFSLFQVSRDQQIMINLFFNRIFFLQLCYNLKEDNAKICKHNPSVCPSQEPEIQRPLLPSISHIESRGNKLPKFQLKFSMKLICCKILLSAHQAVSISLYTKRMDHQTCKLFISGDI